MSKIIS
ncbi:uncharacterized protein FFNC_15545 [Fusarium fujikuroi]|nr:uncharacterized protein FFM5_15347 [Fusarium fujikuroi]SCO54505.1 uncharacterized protein FFNC_15545 [Fusarium fujikuroi]SCV55454.1 uncharacterized protein FFB14_14135 [Fusarium fujikuroi]SCV61452.1 uncharacterized protein FFFS_16022 [Fusarium fujikuroi]